MIEITVPILSEARWNLGFLCIGLSIFFGVLAYIEGYVGDNTDKRMCHIFGVIAILFIIPITFLWKVIIFVTNDTC